MKNVSFETAKALRDAGFPQPEPAEGQFWYDAGAGVWVVGESGLLVFRSLSSRAAINIADMDMSGIVFAPQAHDILFALMDYEKLSLATEGISDFLEIIILPEELAKKWMEFNSKPA